jgi:hypothetical protein
MPLITKKPHKIAGKNYEVHIYYSSTRGFYVHKGLPDEMASYIENLSSKISGEPTEASLNTVLNQLILEYEQKIKTNRLVLVINCVLGHTTHDLMGWEHGSHRNNPLWGNWDHSVKGHGFSIEFCVCREFSVGDQKDYRSRDSSDNGGRILRNNSFFRPGDNSIVIEYSEERAEFLMKMAEAAKGIGEGLAAFFTKDEALMIDRVESARLGQQQGLLGG